MFSNSIRSRLFTFVAFGVLLFLLVALNLAWGAEDIPLSSTLAVLGRVLGLGSDHTFSYNDAYALLEIRLPRALMAILVGATLAICGTALQGLFRNSLAEPALIGISSGATLGAVLVLLLLEGMAVTAGLFDWLVPIGGFATGIFCTFWVYRMASYRGRTSVTHLLLGGIAVNALVNAVLGFLIFIATDAQVRTITFWTLGSLSAATWHTLAVMILPVAIGLVGISIQARTLNALLLGEAEAIHLGIRIQALKRTLFVLIALAVGACVAFTGIIAFVGLVVPQLLRLWLGPDHRFLLPASMLLGSCLLLAADLLARTLAAPAELPIGIITSLVGAPFFIFLLMQSKKRQH